MSRFWLLVKQQQARKWSPLANTMKPEQKDKIHTLIFFVSCILGVLIIPSTNKFIFYLTRQQLNWIPSSSLLCIFLPLCFQFWFFFKDVSEDSNQGNCSDCCCFSCTELRSSVPRRWKGDSCEGPQGHSSHSIWMEMHRVYSNYL